MREEYDDDRTVRKHFKIRRSASSIMIKENNAEIFTEEQLEGMMQYCVTEAEKEGIENLHFETSSKAQIMMCIKMFRHVFI